MTAALAMLAVLLLQGPGDDASAGVVAVAARGEESAGGLAAVAAKAQWARITSVRADFDRNEGVALFEGGVTVDYGDAYRMCADKVYVFFTGSNEFDRVVATGGVAVTNETRTGSCESVVFRRREGEVEMHGGDGVLARLSSSETDEVSGRMIKFWLDAEQVEVSDAEVKIGREKGKAVSL